MVKALLEFAVKCDFLSPLTTVPLVSLFRAVRHHLSVQRSVNDQYDPWSKVKKCTNTSILILQFLHSYMWNPIKEKAKWVYFWEDQQFACFFMQLSWISGKNREKKIISGSCFSLNFRYNFSVPNEVPKVKTLHEFSLELKFSVQ